MPRNWSCSCNWSTRERRCQRSSRSRWRKASEPLRASQGARAPRSGESADGGGSHRAGGGQSPAGGMALHGRGDHRAARLRTWQLSAPADHPQKVREARSGPRPDPAPCRELAGARHCRAWLAGAHHGGKYCDHLPLYRQEQIFAHATKSICPAKLARWLALCADWLQPIYEQIRTGVMAGGYMQIDETPIEYLAPATARPSKVICGRRAVPAETCSSLGHQPGGRMFGQDRPRRLHRHRAVRWLRCLSCLCQRAMASPWPGAGRTCGASLTKPGRAPRPAGWVFCQIPHLYRIESRTA